MTIPTVSCHSSAGPWTPETRYVWENGIQYCYERSMGPNRPLVKWRIHQTPPPGTQSPVEANSDDEAAGTEGPEKNLEEAAAAKL